MKCKNCETMLKEGANFCHHCGTKAVKVCNPCFIKEKPYNCGYEKCPGWKLSTIEMQKAKEVDYI